MTVEEALGALTFLALLIILGVGLLYGLWHR